MDKTVSIYIDMPSWQKPVAVDDFVVTVGIKQSNSVYHVAEVRVKDRGNRTQRCHLKAYRSDLITAIRRSKEQQLITVTWNKR